MAMPVPRWAHLDLFRNPALFGNSANPGALLVSVSLVDRPGNLNGRCSGSDSKVTEPRKLLRTFATMSPLVPLQAATKKMREFEPITQLR
jgi:hypothetical protein